MRRVRRARRRANRSVKAYEHRLIGTRANVMRKDITFHLAASQIAFGKNRTCLVLSRIDHVREYLLEAVQRIVDHLVRIRERRVEAAARKRHNAVCHIGRAHALHGLLAPRHHVLVL
ncbi:hypothetical protein SDC9_163952 [bioreactor metagenome]|uniref:Uncharacterized protein n=1 Tax=bioreactor metagenome TaxID=1076179 RepID=A0A645FQA2_9ZZZZ